MQRITVIGAGAWGTALAAAAQAAHPAADRQVTLWAYEPEVAEAITGTHSNPLYLEGVALDPAIRATADMAEALDGSEMVLLVTPSQVLRRVCGQLATHWPEAAPAVICAKGIEQNSGLLMSEVCAETLPDHVPLAVLSGPSFAREVALGLPAALTVASAEPSLTRTVMEALAGPALRLYGSHDSIGVQIGGAVKNVLAIACGVVEGRKLGDNARAALITRGLSEMARLAQAKGAAAETLTGLSGLGDLVLTCNALQSRNFSFGVQLGEGNSASAILAQRRAVTEGVHTASSVLEMAGKLAVEMPLCSAVDALLNHQAQVDEMVETLMRRPLKSETFGR